MAKLIVLMLASGLFFSVGLIAGQRLSSSNETTHERGTTRSQSVRYSGSSGTAFRTADVDVASTVDNSNLHSLVSSTSVLPAEDLASTERTGPASEVQLQQGATGAQRASILKLIQQRFPDTDAAVAEIWADTYAEMDLDEVTFILEQKHRISSGLGAAVTLPPNNSVAAIPESLKSTPEPAVSSAIRIVETNLSSAYALGFCRMAVFPEASSQSGVAVTATGEEPEPTSFRCFQPGPLIPSPIATHVALSKSDSSMFCLENNRVTRRGDFQLLTDRRLGIITSHGEFAAVESTPIPEDAVRIRITMNGTIQYQIAEGEVRESGRISVCTMNNFSELQSADGMIFEMMNPDDGIIHGDAAGLLVTHCLEQSNVDRIYENSLLQHLKSQLLTSY
ncbi:MAG: hypothetical protein KDB01_27400 [Planctomycetaceae bacterium]|nr:hypothetical protein [Planctomycetaceae bacterium]